MKDIPDKHPLGANAYIPKSSTKLITKIPYTQTAHIEPVPVQTDDMLELLKSSLPYADNILNDFWVKYKPIGIQERILEPIKLIDGSLQVFVSGSNQIGKSFSAITLVRDALLHENKYRKWPRTVKLHWVTETEGFQLDTIQSVFTEHCGDLLRKLKEAPACSSSKAWKQLRFNGPYGVDEFNFHTYMKKLPKGFTADALFMDEGQKYWDWFQAAALRLARKKGLLYWAMEPDSKALPIYEKIFEPFLAGKTWEQRIVVMGNKEDYITAMAYDHATNSFNYNAAKKDTDYLEATLDKDVFEKRCCGLWGAGTGLVYPFKYDQHVVSEFPIPKHWRKDIFMDYAWSSSATSKKINPNKIASTTATFIAMVPPNEQVTVHGTTVTSTQEHPLWFIYKEYGTKEVRLANEHGDAICRLIEKDEYFYSIISDQIDNSAFHLLRESFKKIGLGGRIYKVRNKSIKTTRSSLQTEGHELIKALYGNNQIYIMQNCRQFIGEISNYYIDRDTGRPQEFGNDRMDPQRYYFNTQPKYIAPSPSYRNMMDDLEDEEDGDYSSIGYTSDYVKSNGRIENYAGRMK
jgi:hypothetical protein